MFHRHPEESAAPKIRDPKEAQEPWLGIPVDKDAQPPSSTTTTTSSKARGDVDVSNARNDEALNAASVYNTAGGGAMESHAVEPAKDEASSVATTTNAPGDTTHTFQSVTRKVSELVDEAETKAKSVYDQAREKVREVEREMGREVEEPQTVEQQRLAAGEIPKSTEEVLRERKMRGGDV